ncbi:hypothetical protein R1sor_014184 [Riccia sorocarpa]|uniref:Uncharacterized protein n=1 Tax=Riccia sorocarpa TaxID=122646 RepID=A0ABD3HCF6_9MARC
MISLYRGELHKVSSVPRQWTIPKSNIPISVFIKALKKRNDALLRELQSSSSPEAILLPISVTPVRQGESLKFISSETREVVSVETLAPGAGCGGAGCFSEENKNLSLSGKRAESCERNEEENEFVQERKRKKLEDRRKGNDRKTSEDDAHQIDERASPVQAKGPGWGSFQSVRLDADDQSEEMDCDVSAAVITGSDLVEDMGEHRKVSVSETSRRQELELDFIKVESGDPNPQKAVFRSESAKCWEQISPDFRESSVHPLSESATATNVSCPKRADFGDVVEEKVIEKTARKRKRQELQAKLRRLTADKHHLVLVLKQVLNDEESRKRVLSANTPHHGGPEVTCALDVPVVAGNGEKLGGLQPSGDLEEGELEYARTPSPPPRPVQNNHNNLNSHNVLGPPPPAVPVLGRQNTLTQHISQGSSGRGGYYVPGSGIPPSPVGPGIGGGGAVSPGAVYMGNLQSPLGPHNFSHNLALQHAAAMHAAQKIVSVPPVHSQFNPIPPNGAPVGAGPGVTGGPPGFGGYVVPPPMHPHHAHQTGASSASHLPVQQGVVSSSLLTTPRGPVGFHDMRLPGNTWIPRMNG